MEVLAARPVLEETEVMVGVENRIPVLVGVVEEVLEVAVLVTQETEDKTLLDGAAVLEQDKVELVEVQPPLLLAQEVAAAAEEYVPEMLMVLLAPLKIFGDKQSPIQKEI
jgi:hypothetical protein